jgi:hypothetical protein
VKIKDATPGELARADAEVRRRWPIKTVTVIRDATMGPISLGDFCSPLQTIDTITFDVVVRSETRTWPYYRKETYELRVRGS